MDFIKDILVKLTPLAALVAGIVVAVLATDQLVQVLAAFLALWGLKETLKD